MKANNIKYHKNIHSNKLISGSKSSKNKSDNNYTINSTSKKHEDIKYEDKKDEGNKPKLLNNENDIEHNVKDNNYMIYPNNKKYEEAKLFLKQHNIMISTITLDCTLNTNVILDNFAKHVVLIENEIVSIKFGNRNDMATNRTIIVIKKKKKPSTKNFYNQVTILMKPTNILSNNYINIKVFQNGSLQMTGCKDMEDFFNVTNKLIKILKKGKTVLLNKKKIHIDFITDPDKIGISNINIRMINSNFRLDYKIDRKKLAKLLKKNHSLKTKDTEIGYVECTYKPNGGHSCVNIKYHYDELNKPSIFVFQTGAIIITGAKRINHIIAAYHFIMKILSYYRNEIQIINLDPKAVQLEIDNFFRNKKKLTNQISCII